MVDLTEKIENWILDLDECSETGEDQINWSLCSPMESPNLLSGISHLLQTKVVPLVWMVQIQNKRVTTRLEDFP